jgi:nicotinamide-nucleotide amidase
VNIELLNTGSELMLGRVLNTHQQWLCRRLADLGYVVTRQVAVPDTAHDIQSAVREALGRADLIITTGGLGPTSDDLTRDLIAQLLGKKLRLDEAVLDHIRNVLRRATCRCQKPTKSRRWCPKVRWCWPIRTAPPRGWR